MFNKFVATEKLKLAEVEDRDLFIAHQIYLWDQQSLNRKEDYEWLGAIDV